MPRSRSVLFGALVVVALILAGASALFGVQYARDSAECTVVAGTVCVGGLATSDALNALFASVSGLVVAIGMAAALGFTWQQRLAPNLALAKQIEDEEHKLQDYKLRRAQLDEWTAMAQARALELAAQEAVAARVAMEEEARLWAEASRWVEEEGQQEETEEEQRSRALAEYMMALARKKPERVAEVVSSWINQRER